MELLVRIARAAPEVTEAGLKSIAPGIGAGLGSIGAGIGIGIIFPLAAKEPKLFLALELVVRVGVPGLVGMASGPVVVGHFAALRPRALGLGRADPPGAARAAPVPVRRGSSSRPAR